jgi:hypothetical protein
VLHLSFQWDVAHGVKTMVGIKGKSGAYIRKPVTEEAKRNMSKARKGIKFSEEHKRKLSETRRGEKNHNWGKPHSEEWKRNMSELHMGERSSNWKGGITPINRKIRNSIEMKLWREAVFKRDNWTCVLCNVRGVKLNADHIKRFSDFPNLHFELSNGRTLCVPCHENTDTYGNKKMRCDKRK